MAILAGHDHAFVGFTGILVVNMSCPDLMHLARARGLGRVAGLLLCLVAAIGCRKAEPKDAPSAPISTPESANSDPLARPAAPTVAETVPAPEAVLAKLAGDHSNPYLANNAKAALEAWNRRDYDQSVVYLQTLLNLRLTPDQQAQAMAAVGGIREGLDRAAQSGSASAKAALTRLSTMSAP